MARYRISRPAQADLARILGTSAQRWGIENRRRYAALLAAAIRKLAANTNGPTTRDRAELTPGLRSFHIRHARAGGADTKVGGPVHIVYYRNISPDSIEIVRVLHERMDPVDHVDASSKEKD